MITLFAIGLFFITLVMGIPVFISLLFGVSGGLVFWGTIPLEVIPQRLFTGLDSFVLIAIPFFIMTGLVMERGGLSKMLLDMTNAVVGGIRGSLAIANVVASMVFAGVTGAASADTASVGSIIIPGMIKKKYDPAFSVAVTITSSTIGVIIPPSIPMVIFSVLSGCSVAELFLAGMIPGLLIGSALIGISYGVSCKRGYPVDAWMGLRYCLVQIVKGLPPLAVVVVIFGGIIAGIMTPTEAAVVAAIYAILLCIFAYKTLSWKSLIPIFIQTASFSSMVVLLIAASNAFSWLLTTQQVPLQLKTIMLAVTDNPTIILLIISGIYLLVGMVIDLTPAMLLLVPVFLPLVKSLEVDLLHFGIITVMALAIGLYTPPVGTCLAVGLAIQKVPILEITRELVPFFLVMILVLLLIIVFPSFSLLTVKLVIG